VDPPREVAGRLEDAAPRGEALDRIVGELARALDVRRLEEEFRRLDEMRGVRAPQARTHRLPGDLRRRAGGPGARLGGDLGFDADDQFFVRRRDERAYGAVAVVVVTLAQLARGRLERDAMRLAGLVRQRPRREVQELLRKHHRRRIVVPRLVNDG